jgi:hypothetical protein
MQNARETASKQGRNDWENFMPGGSDYVDPSAPKSKAPNQTALQAQAAAFTGNLYIHGAPAGSTMDSINTGASSIDMTQAGVN